jgi:hypothetical protein
MEYYKIRNEREDEMDGDVDIRIVLYGFLYRKM